MSFTDDETLDFSDYTCVFASTLNQMVNYIPLTMFSFKEVYSVTLYSDSEKKTKVKENKKWDGYLSELVSGINEIKIWQNDFLKVSETIKAFEFLGNKKIFWNITGGQRPFLLAVLEFVKDKKECSDDYIAYLEGNTGMMSITKANQFGDSKAETLIEYYLPTGTDLSVALKLMGFKVSDEKFNKTASEKIDEKEQEFWVGFHKKYCEDTSSKLRENLVMLNKKNHEKEKKEKGAEITEEEKKEKATKIAQEKKGYWKAIYEEFNLDLDNDVSYLKHHRLVSKNPYPFGYILEKMVLYVLTNTFSDKVQQIFASLKTYVKVVDSDEKGVQADGKKTKEDEKGGQADEFDIIVLTKQGIIINFECKSGMMEGDVAKSTKYSTYAISGVYGLPILITPLLKSELSDKKGFPFDSSYQANSAAEKAGLEVWGIDEIAKNLEDKLKEKLK